jgi:hypothetical protein
VLLLWRNHLNRLVGGVLGLKLLKLAHLVDKPMWSLSLWLLHDWSLLLPVVASLYLLLLVHLLLVLLVVERSLTILLLTQLVHRNE